LFDIVKPAIRARADTRLSNRFGGVMLVPAAERGHVEIAQAPLTYSDLEVDRVNRLGWAALLEAILLGEGKRAHQQIVQTMAEAECRSRVPISGRRIRTASRHCNTHGGEDVRRSSARWPRQGLEVV